MADGGLVGGAGPCCKQEEGSRRPCNSPASERGHNLPSGQPGHMGLPVFPSGLFRKNSPSNPFSVKKPPLLCLPVVLLQLPGFSCPSLLLPNKPVSAGEVTEFVFKVNIANCPFCDISIH